MKNHPVVSSTLAAIVLAWSGSQSHAAGAPVLSNSASLGVVQYRLIDLDLSDGIQASVTFDPAGAMRLYAAEYSQSGGWNNQTIEFQDLDRTGVPFTNELSGAVQLSGDRAFVTSTSGQINATSVFDADQMAARVASTPIGSSIAYRQDAGGSLRMNYTLSPKTRIEFSVSVTLSDLLDLAALQNSTASGPVTAELSSVARGLILGTGGAASDVFQSVSSISRTVKIDALGQVLSDVSNTNRYGDLFLSSSNLGKFATTNALELSAAVSPSISFSPKAPIPEPGTWLLMALGLAGVGFATRQRHAQAKS